MMLVAEALRPKAPEIDLAAVAKSCATHFSI